MSEYFATRLAAGRVSAPASTRWWPRHSCLVSQYLLLRRAKEREGIKAARAAMTEMASEWAGLFPERGRKLAAIAMAEHTSIEWALIDAAAAGDAAGVDAAAAGLSSNVRDLTLVSGAEVPGFPEGAFEALLSAHVGLLAGSIRAHLDGRSTAFDGNEQARRRNTVALAALTTEWF